VLKQRFQSIRISLLILVFTGVLVLGGCLVDESDSPTPKSRNGIVTFRTIAGGDFYEYIVQAQVTATGGATPQYFSGTLNVTYTTDTLPGPLTVGGTLAVLREDSTLTLGATVYTLTRYIQQDGSGTLFVLAVRFSGTLYRTGEDDVFTNPHAIAILTSDIPLSGNVTNVDYQYMDNCESPNTSCSSVVQTINDSIITYQGDANITTNEGVFEAIRIDYDGLFFGPSAPTLFDIRGACDEDTATFFGSTYIFPVVGIVFFDRSCTSFSGGGHSYTASLSNTNVPIP
jgi:hypothetical protein